MHMAKNIYFFSFKKKKRWPKAGVEGGGGAKQGTFPYIVEKNGCGYILKGGGDLWRKETEKKGKTSKKEKRGKGGEDM